MEKKQFQIAAEGTADSSAIALSGIVLAFITIAVFTLATFVLRRSLAPIDDTVLPQIADLITSMDTRAQRRGFICAAILLASALLWIFLAKPAIPPAFRKNSQILVLYIDRIFRLKLLQNAMGSPVSRWLSLLLLLIACIGCVAAVFIGAFSHTAYGGDSLMVIKVSDPHINSVLGLFGEVLAGRYSTVPDGMGYYGFGPAAIYAAGRSIFGFAGGYAYNYNIARGFNAIAVTFLFWQLLGWNNKNIRLVQLLLIISASIAFSIPILLPNNLTIYTANLTGIRYVPLFIFMAATYLVSKNTSLPSLIVFGIASSLGMIYSADVGFLCLIGYIVFVCLHTGTIAARIAKGFIVLAISTILLVIYELTIGSIFHINVLGILGLISGGGDANFGGAPVGFDLLQFALAVLFITVAVALVLESNTRALDGEERFIVATCLMAFLWYSYYLHRPGPYWIFPYLGLVVLGYLLRRMGDWSTEAIRVGGTLALIFIAVMADQNVKYARKAFKQERAFAQSADGMPVADLGGVKVEKSFADGLRHRIATLNRLQTPDSIVITAYPYLVTTESKVVNAPRDMVFGLPTQTAIDALVAETLAKKPSRLFLEPKHTDAWGVEAMRAITQKVEDGIAGCYTRDETIEDWRVWNLTPASCRQSPK